MALKCFERTLKDGTCFVADIFSVEENSIIPGIFLGVYPNKESSVDPELATVPTWSQLSEVWDGLKVWFERALKP